MKLGLAIFLSVLIAGCATSGDTVRSGEQVQRERAVRPGVVESTRDVTIEGGQPTGAGGVIGAVVGGVGGSYVGSGHGTIIGSVVGSVLGGLAGNAAERVGSRKPGVELTIRLDEGRTIVVVQSVAEELFKTGDRVRVISDGATARVSK